MTQGARGPQGQRGPGCRTCTGRGWRAPRGLLSAAGLTAAHCGIIGPGTSPSRWLLMDRPSTLMETTPRGKIDDLGGGWPRPAPSFAPSPLLPRLTTANEASASVYITGKWHAGVGAAFHFILFCYPSSIALPPSPPP